MPIYRQTLKDYYVQISNKLARSKDLSPEALGMLVHMLSMSPDFNPTKKEMRSRVAKIGDKRFDTAYAELQESGYVYSEKRLSKQHHFDYQWYVSSEPWSKEKFLERILG